MKLDIEPGSKVKIKQKSKGKEEEFEGILIESHDPSIVLLKLKSGYNIGFKKEEIEIKVLEKPKEKKETKEEISQDKKLPSIAIIVTGGTIASKVDYETGAVSPNLEISGLLKNIPGLEKIARINEIEVPFLKLSEDINSDDWKKLAKKTCELINKKDIKGIIILHGTDTLHFTSSALAFMLKELGKPVVLTYSQRSIDRGSSDANLNLKCAFHAALSNIAEVIVVGHALSGDEYCFAFRGTKVRKMHSSRRDTFKAINSEPLAKIYENGNIEKLAEYSKRDETKKCKLENDFEEKIALIKFYPGASPEILNYYIKMGYKGIIIEGSGFGHVATEGKYCWLPALKEACKKAVICMTTQTIFGEVNSKVYSAGRMIEKTGVLYLGDMLAETAYTKLGCILGKEKDFEKVKKLMQENVAHEFQERRVE
jgi:glutamyl-tRNA(Gln) amidotransferase subunit D